MEPWEPPTLAGIAIWLSLPAVSDLLAMCHCVMFGDAALDFIGYQGGGGVYTEAVGYSFAGYSPGKAYAANCRSSGLGLVGTVGCAAGMVSCRFIDGFTGGGVPVFFPESFHVVE